MVGKVMEAAAATAGASITKQAFNFIKAGTTKAGLNHKPAMVGKVMEAAAATAGASITKQAFNFIKCGTRKTMQ
jgi:hypothetical protein